MRIGAWASVWRCGFNLEKDDAVFVNEPPDGRYLRLNWFCGSAEQCVPQSARVHNREVAEAAAAEGPQGRAGAVSGDRVGVCRAVQAVFPNQEATALSW